MLCVDDFTHFKIIRFLECKGEATATMRDIIATYGAPFGLKLGIVRTDGGEDFGGPFQPLLQESEIQHEHPPHHRPLYNGVVERGLGLLCNNTVALLRDMMEGKTDGLWADAITYAYDMSNQRVTTSIDQSIYPFQLWHGHLLSLTAFCLSAPSGT